MISVVSVSFPLVEFLFSSPAKNENHGDGVFVLKMLNPVKERWGGMAPILLTLYTKGAHKVQKRSKKVQIALRCKNSMPKKESEEK